MKNLISIPMRRGISLAILFIGCFIIARGQDPVYSQAFLSPIYLNPAATGCGDYDVRVSAIARKQWWKIPSAMNYVAVSYDKFFEGIKGGLGAIVTHSSEGYTNKNGVYGTYSYAICSGTGNVAGNRTAPEWFWTGGLQFGIAQTNINYDKLVFADQLNTNGYILNSISSASAERRSGRFFPDFAAGTFFNYNLSDHSRFLGGFSAHHINRPDESLTFSGDSIQSRIPVRWTANLLYTHTNYSQTWSYSLGAIVYKQLENFSTQIGLEVSENTHNISAGLWYRGRTNFTQINTFNVSISFNIPGTSGGDKFRVGIGHDSEIGQAAYSATAGSSEIGFVWDHSSSKVPENDPCKPKINSTICPGVTNY